MSSTEYKSILFVQFLFFLFNFFIFVIKTCLTFLWTLQNLHMYDEASNSLMFSLMFQTVCSCGEPQNWFVFLTFSFPTDVVNSKLGMPRPQIGPSISQQGFFSSRDSLSVPCVSQPLQSYSAATSDMDLSRKNESKSTSKLKPGEQPLLSSWNPSTAPRESIAHPTTASTSVNHLGSNNGSGVANNNTDRWVMWRVFGFLYIFRFHDDDGVSSGSRGQFLREFHGISTHKKRQFAHQKNGNSDPKP